MELGLDEFANIVQQLFELAGTIYSIPAYECWSLEEAYSIIPDDEKAPYAGQPISLRTLAALLGWQGGPLSLRSLLLLDEEVEVIELAPV